MMIRKKMKQVTLLILGLALPLMPLMPQVSEGMEGIYENGGPIVHNWPDEIDRFRRNVPGITDGIYLQGRLVTPHPGPGGENAHNEVEQNENTLLYLMEHGWEGLNINTTCMNAFLHHATKSLSKGQQKYFDLFHENLINSLKFFEIKYFPIICEGLVGVSFCTAYASSAIASESLSSDKNQPQVSQLPVGLYGSIGLLYLVKMLYDLRTVCQYWSQNKNHQKLIERYQDQKEIKNQLKVAALYATLKRTARLGGGVLVNDGEINAVDQLRRQECPTLVKQLFQRFRGNNLPGLLFLNHPHYARPAPANP